MNGQTIAAAVLLFLATSVARAQVMDYGALEQLFGEPVTTSATGSPQKAADAPVNMEIITADDIRRSGADNIPDVLRIVAGVDVRRYGRFDADIGIRGYNSANSPRVLVLLNGRQLYVDFHNYTAWATLPVQLEEIRQIEVIKGPNTALFGFNAVAGVINIVTYNPLHDSVREVTARGDTQGAQMVSAVSTIQFSEDAALRVSLGEHGTPESSFASLPPSYGPYASHDYSKSGYVEGHAMLGSGIHVGGEFDLSTVKQFEMTVGGYPGWTAYDSDHEKLEIGRDSGLGYLDLNAYRNAVKFSYFPGENCQTCITIDNSLIVVQASDLLRPAADHTIRLALEYRNNRGGGTAYSGEDFGFDLLAASAMWNWQLAPGMAVTNSLRLDHVRFTYRGPVAPGVAYTAAQYNSRPITEPSFNSALVAAVAADDSVRLSVARGVQMPDFYSLFPQPVSTNASFSVGTVSAFEGTPDLRPSEITNYEVDYDHALPTLSSRAQIALYYQTSDDVIGPPGDAGVTDPLTNFGYAANIGSSRSIGGELTVKGATPSGWHWRAGYAVVTISDHLAVDRGNGIPFSSIDYRHGTPTHSVTLGFGRHWDRLEADLFARWQSHFDDIAIDSTGTVLARTPIRNVVTVDARLGYEVIDGLTLALSASQLNQASILSTAGTPSERRIIGSATVRF